MGGVPASNFHGTSLGVKPSTVTLVIISPPPMNGGMASSSSARAHRAPMPVGPHILWAEKATKSASHACTSTGRWGTAWHASTSTWAPAAWAASASGPDVVDGAEHVGHRAEREQLGAVEQLVEVGEVEAVVGGERDPPQLDAPLGGEDLPGHDVGVVLHVGEHDRVALAAGWRGPTSTPRG